MSNEASEEFEGGNEPDWAEVAGEPGAGVQDEVEAKVLKETVEKAEEQAEEQQEEEAPAEEEVAEEEQEEEEQQEEEGAPQQVDMAALRATEVKRLESVYSVSEDDVRVLAVEPEKVLPKIAAQLHVNVVEAIVNTIGAQLPQAVRAIAEQDRKRREAQDAFYSRFPTLKDKKYSKDVADAINLVRAQNPAAKMDEVIVQAGITASLKNRLALPKDLVGDAPQERTVTKSRPFTPATPSASKPKAKATSDANAFEALAGDFLNED